MRELVIQALLSSLGFRDDINLLEVLLKLLLTQLLVFFAQLRVKLSLRMVRQVKTHLDASLLPCQSHGRRQLVYDTLVEVALVHEYHRLRGD